MKLKLNNQPSKKSYGTCSPVWPIQRWKELGDKKRKEKKMILKKQRLISEQNYLMKTENDNQITSYYDDEQETESQGSSGSTLIIQEINSGYEDSIILFCGMQVSPHGIVKLTTQMNHISFGLHEQFSSKRIRLLMNLGIVDIQRQSDFNLDIIRNVKENRIAKDQAFQILNKKPDPVNVFIMNQISYAIDLFEERESLSGPAPHHFREGFMELKNIEYQEFIDECFEFLKTMPKNQMYQYNIGRVHPINDQADMLHSGYSQEYLDLLGIDTTALTSLFLRKKTIDLVLDSPDINKLSANILSQIKECRYNFFHDYEEFKEGSKRQNARQFLSEQVTSKIRTFDGFELNLSQKVRGVLFPMNYYYNGGRLVDCSCGYFLQIFELDVDLYELEALIAYRIRLQQQGSQLSLDDYLQRELSLMFEDVEYSVRSQEFLDKYYTNSLPSLRQIQLTKEEMMQQESIRCKYRKIQ